HGEVDRRARRRPRRRPDQRQDGALGGRRAGVAHRGIAWAELDRSGRVIVEPDLSLPGHPEVFVVGDLALAMQDGKPVPGVAQGALQGGRHAASCIVASLSGKPSTPFHYKDKGMLAAIGRAAAVADLPNIDLTGFPAWVIWAVVHIYFLIGFRNRLFVMAHWSWAFLTHDRAARLITGSPTLR